MSRIEQKSKVTIVTGKPRRITAKWMFNTTATDDLYCSKTSVHSDRMTERESKAKAGWSHLPQFHGESSTKRLPQAIDGAYHHTHCSTSSGHNSHEEPSSAEDSFNDCMSDGTDSGLGSGTTLSVNQEVLEYLADNLIHLMNPTLVLPHLMNYGLVNKDDADFINSPKLSDDARKQRILTALAVQDGDVVDRLVDCLSKDMVYSNHRFIARRLREAMDKKRKHPDVPLSTLRLGTPPRDSKEVSPPVTPIRPRGAAQRNSIAKLLATKRNNVANLISQIETKETAHHQQLNPIRPKQYFDIQHNTPEKVETNSTIISRNVQSKTRISNSPSPVVMPLSPRPSAVSPTFSSDSGHHPFSPHHTPQPTPSLHHNHPVTLPSSPAFSPHHTPQPTSSLHHNHPVTLPSSPVFSPSHTPQPHSSLHRNHPVTLPSSPAHDVYSSKQPHSYFSYPHPPSHTTQTEVHSVTSPHITSSHIHSSHPSYPPSSPSHVSSPPPISSPHITALHPHSHHPPYQPSSPSPVSLPPPLPLKSPPPPVTSPQAIQHGGQDSTRTVSSSYKRDSIKREKLLEERVTPDLQRNSLPDILDSPTRYPPVSTEGSSDDRGAGTPDTDIMSPRDMVVHHRQRPARHPGITARFYRHRRSASMSTYDTRSFKRGDHHYASDNWGKLERSGYRHGGTGREDDDGGKVRASVREGAEKLVRRRIDWLQERVHFTNCPEHIQFISHTHYGQERELLYSGTLNKHGKPRFVVLFTDYLLVLKAKRPNVPSKLGGVFSFQQSSSRIDWFSDLEYTTRKPFPLHLLTVQHQRNKLSNDTFCLHFNEKNKVLEIILQAVSKEARDIWVEELSEAITEATSAHADSFLLVGNKAQAKKSGEPYKQLQLQIHSASSLGLAANCNSFSLFCVIELGKQRCRTPSVLGGYNPSWEYKCEFTDFDDEDSLLLEIFSENIFRPNDFLGCLNVPLSSLPEEQPGRKKFEGNMVLAGLEEAFAGEIHITVEQGWETKM